MEQLPYQMWEFSGAGSKAWEESMSEASSEEKEFDPSPRRLQQARDEEGSVESINDAAMMLVLVLMIFAGGNVMGWFCEATRDAILLVGQGHGKETPS